MIIQWGSGTYVSSAGRYTYTLPIAFSNASSYTVFILPGFKANVSDTPYYSHFGVNYTSASQFQFERATSYGDRWFAVGY